MCSIESYQRPPALVEDALTAWVSGCASGNTADRVERRHVEEKVVVHDSREPLRMHLR